ncbi:unnamed protein product [Effrenium voratum]|nr:unnamed protein product [Effrenium voratum]
MDIDDACIADRSRRYRVQAAKKKQRDGPLNAQDYYRTLLAASRARTDEAAAKDRHQIETDLPRTFAPLPLRRLDLKAQLTQSLRRVLLAYIERGRSLNAATKKLGLAAWSGAATTSRGILTGYPQGLDHMAGMCLLALASEIYEGIEEDAFWLLAMLLEETCWTQTSTERMCGGT